MNKNRELLVKIILGSTEPVSCEKSNSLSYLKEEGLDAEAIKAEGIKRLKKLQLQLNAAKTKQNMLAHEKAKREAADWAEKILSDISFSFSDFVRDEKMVLQNRNIASFTKDDIRHTLTQYLFMKIISSDKPYHAE